MPPRTPPRPDDSASVRHRQKATQRERLLEAILEITARDGYTHTTVTKIVSAAQVSRPTFYEYFADKDTCLLAALTTINRELLSQATLAVRQADPSRAALATTDAIIDFCHADPAAARVWLSECLAGASPTLDSRDDGIDALARLIDQAYLRASPEAIVPDVGSRALVGGIHRILGSHVRQGESIAAARQRLHAWIESYGVPYRARQWPGLSIGAAAGAEPSADPPFGARPGHRSTARSPERNSAEHHRDLIFFAAAQLLAEKRHDQIALAEIAKHAGIGYRRLTGLFGDRERIYAGLHELACLRTLAATSAGYFSRDAWPDRVWAAAEACTHYVGGNATLAGVGFLLPYAAGPRPARQMDKVLKSFTVFLHEGYAHLPSGHEPPDDVALTAIAATIFELGYRECRAGRSAELPGLLAQAVFVALAPFLGVQEAGRFVEEKLAMQAGDSSPSQTPPGSPPASRG
jgi:AcrR family transcriptional regulator